MWSWLLFFASSHQVISKEHSSSYGELCCRVQVEEARGGSQSQGHQWTGREASQELADLVRAADTEKALPGTIMGDLICPWGAQVTRSGDQGWGSTAAQVGRTLPLQAETTTQKQGAKNSRSHGIHPGKSCAFGVSQGASSYKTWCSHPNWAWEGRCSCPSRGLQSVPHFLLTRLKRQTQ